MLLTAKESDSTLCTATKMKILGTPSTSLAYFQRTRRCCRHQENPNTCVRCWGWNLRLGVVPVGDAHDLGRDAELSLRQCVVAQRVLPDHFQSRIEIGSRHHRIEHLGAVLGLGHAAFQHHRQACIRIGIQWHSLDNPLMTSLRKA